MADFNIDFGILKPLDFVGDLGNAFQVGRALARQNGEQQAMSQYATDPQGAVQNLMRYNPAQAMQLQEFLDNQAQQQQAQADRQSSITQAQAEAGGDLQGAMQAAASRGATGDVMTIKNMIDSAPAQQKAAAIQAAQQANEATAHILMGLKGVPDPNQRLAMAQHLAAQSGGAVDPNSITLNDVTDQGINAHLANAMSIDQMLRQAHDQEEARHNKVSEGFEGQKVNLERQRVGIEGARLAFDKSQAAAGGGLTPDSLDYAAEMYRQTGVMPALGMKSSGARTAILNRAAQLASQGGATAADDVVAHAQTRAGTSTLKQAMERQNLLEQNAAEAYDMGNLVLKLAPTGEGPFSWPILNAPVQAIRSAFGNKDVTRFEGAIGSYAEKYARVMTAATGNAAATDSARDAAKQRLHSAMADGQLRGAIDVMNREMEIQRQQNAASVSRIRGSIRSGAPPATAPIGNAMKPTGGGQKTPGGYTVEEVQ